MRWMFVMVSVVAMGCGGGAAEGEACEVTADCEEGLECHMHDGAGECHAGDEHDDDDTDHSEHEE